MCPHEHGRSLPWMAVLRVCLEQKLCAANAALRAGEAMDGAVRATQDA